MVLLLLLLHLAPYAGMEDVEKLDFTVYNTSNRQQNQDCMQGNDVMINQRTWVRKRRRTSKEPGQ